MAVAAPTAQNSPELHFRFINSFIQPSLLKSLVRSILNQYREWSNLYSTLNFELNAQFNIQILNGSNPVGQSRDTKIIDWIKKRFEASELDYMEYPYEVMLSYPTDENKVSTFFLFNTLYYSQLFNLAIVYIFKMESG